MLPPELGRKLTEEERAALEACRACAAKEPARRIASAAEAERLLTERRRWWWCEAAVGRVETRRDRCRRADRGCGRRGRGASLAAEIAGYEAAVSAGFAPDRPDRRARRLDGHLDRARGGSRTGSSARACCQTSARSVSSGARRHARRTSTRSRGRRVPSPLVPAAYADGCPDLSPDGKRLVYQGHAPTAVRSRFYRNMPTAKAPYRSFR